MLIGYLTATGPEVASRLGTPSSSPCDKSRWQWEVETSTGEAVTVYDDADREPFEYPHRWHVGLIDYDAKPPRLAQSHALEALVELMGDGFVSYRHNCMTAAIPNDPELPF